MAPVFQVACVSESSVAVPLPLAGATAVSFRPAVALSVTVVAALDAGSAMAVPLAFLEVILAVSL